jgi:hypothetical protein
LTYVAAIALGFILIFFTEGGRLLGEIEIKSLPIDLFILIRLAIDVRARASILFIILWVFYALCFMAAFASNKGLISALHRLPEGDKLSQLNYLFLFPILANGLLALVVLIHLIQESQGLATGSLPPRDPYIELFEVSYAPLYEELNYRISPLGGWLALRTFWLANSIGMKRWKSLRLSILAFVFPEKAKIETNQRSIRHNGLRNGVSGIEWVLVLATSAIFGSLHFLGGGGWQLGKITSAFISGIALALVYLSHGIFAPILLHWFFNSYFVIYSLASREYGSVFLAISPAIYRASIDFGIAVLFIFMLSRMLNLKFMRQLTHG